MVYLAPTSLKEALATLGRLSPVVVAGGTDFFPALGERAGPDHILDVTKLDGFRGISKTGAGWRIGAATSWTDVIKATLPPAFDGLKAAAREVGSVQIQNTGTIAGNLCNASPAADGVPPLLTLDAMVELVSTTGARQMPLAEFIRGPRDTALARGELLSAIIVPEIADTARSAFLKLGARRYLVISIAMVSVIVVPDAKGCVAEARIAVGACSPVACRLPALEAALVGLPIEQMSDAPDAAHLGKLTPIADVRASSEYRQDAALELVRSCLAQTAKEIANG